MKRAALLVGIWLLAQLAWLQADARIVEGDVLAIVGALELFWEEGPFGLATALKRALLEDFGEYPMLVPALQGWLCALLGVGDLNGDAPAAIGLLWAAGSALAAWLLGSRHSPLAGLLAVAILLGSPLFSGLARHVLLENGMAAFVGLAAAAGLRGRWLACGVLAGLALLSKQTAVLALLPLVVALIAGDRLNWRRHLGSLGIAAGIAAPWYLRRLGGEAEYLGRSVEANPDAVGTLHQLAYYPLVLAQQPWAPAALLGLLGCALWARRRPKLTAEAAIAALGIALLILLPKKYPRLLLPLLPLMAAWLGVWLARWPGRPRAVALGWLALCWAASLGVVGPLGPTSLGLTGVDERCAQQWVRPPGPGLDWDGLIGSLGGSPIGALDWPVPPCAHQTTLDLGEHLRIRLRRAGSEADVMAGESFVQAGGWARRPRLLLHDGPLPCPGAPGCLAATEVGRFALHDPSWPLDLRVFRVAP